jgi:hypothetical protein
MLDSIRYNGYHGGMRLGRTFLGIALTFWASAAPAQEADRRIDDLVAKQKDQEAELAALKKRLRELERSPAPREPEPPPATRFTLGSLASEEEQRAPIAGYSWKNFFLRDRNSWFVFTPKGRINVDWYNFLNRPPPPSGVQANSAADPRASLRDTIFIRRARIGIAGTLVRVIDFRVEAEFAQLAQPGQYATLADADVVVNVVPWLRFEAGQFYSPFTLENMTSENFTDFMEKSTVVRWAVPTARDAGAMLFGEAPSNVVRYWVGLFNGDGQNYKNLDNQPAFEGRLVLAPLGLIPRHAKWLEDIWVGGSFWWQRADNLGGAVVPSTTAPTAGDLATLSTEGGFPVFTANYANGTDAMMNAIRSHLAPDGNTYKYAFELNVPVFNRYGLRSEYVHQSIDVRQYDDVNPGNGNFVRSTGQPGHIDGWGAYVELYAWVGGDVNPDRPGLYSIPHWIGYVPPKRPQWALQFAAKYEHVEFDLSQLVPTAIAGHWGLDTFSVGANFWVTRHARIMANYNLNYVGLGDPTLAAPAEKKNLFFQKFEHELLFRLQVNL